MTCGSKYIHCEPKIKNVVFQFSKSGPLHDLFSFTSFRGHDLLKQGIELLINGLKQRKS